ncbi:NAD(P)-binding protein [Pseudoduganella sp. DS3]|uniref:NAD(P)-binding protein n=1 Tax=Pseudoduganella guangdongensis TaxID=2692179 RepID=A0A6N9HLY9_9BURK|nr:NAD(P)-binding protein [Pseudoduganella guangdongensis]
MAKRFAVVGGGWAGFSAAVELARSGHQVTVFEGARTVGGRARRVDIDGRVLDNGQHILLGAYREALRLMRLVGVDLNAAILKLPLQMRYPNGTGMDFIAPRLPAPLHVGIALLRARGLEREDKLALARFSTTARWMGWRLNNDCSVAELLERFEQTPRLVQLMWRPLCLAALNTPLEHASAQVFLAVLRDSLGAGRAASDMLLPRVDLSALFPAAAAAWLQKKGHQIHLGAKISTLQPGTLSTWLVGEAEFDGVVLATAPAAAAALLQPLEATAALAAQLAGLESEPITTCYLQYPAGTRLETPFYALVDDPASRRYGQFVFDRGQLDPRQEGLFAVVISAASAAAELPQEELAAALASQLAADLGRPALAQPSWTRVITDKRATFACTAGLERPANATALDGLVLAGDYTQGDYPATLEMAVRSGVQAAKLLAGAARRSRA